MEHVRKDEIIEQMKNRYKKIFQMLQTKIKHLSYRVRELIIPISASYHNYDEIDRRENEMQRGFNEVVDLLEKQINPSFYSGTSFGNQQAT
mmetsp:Transcript_27889/g.20897  ORF Transcript_27889/g.20897 Transcript_27889/m.20897 type:complete len:91 (+) Transcript_27889:206-478(+)